MRGEEVDFDLLATKQKMEENKPRVLEVKQREDFVHKRRKSRGRRSIMNKIQDNKKTADAKTAPETKEETKKESSTPKATSSKTKRTIVKKGSSTTNEGKE